MFSYIYKELLARIQPEYFKFTESICELDMGCVSAMSISIGRENTKPKLYVI